MQSPPPPTLDPPPNPWLLRQSFPLTLPSFHTCSSRRENPEKVLSLAISRPKLKTESKVNISHPVPYKRTFPPPLQWQLCSWRFPCIPLPCISSSWHLNSLEEKLLLIYSFVSLEFPQQLSAFEIHFCTADSVQLCCMCEDRRPRHIYCHKKWDSSSLPSLWSLYEPETLRVTVCRGDNM